MSDVISFLSSNREGTQYGWLGAGERRGGGMEGEWAVGCEGAVVSAEQSIQETL
jgi:hypothetical protein